MGQGDPRHRREAGLSAPDRRAMAVPASLQEVRERIDALDERIVPLLEIGRAHV